MALRVFLARLLAGKHYAVVPAWMSEDIDKLIEERKWQT